MNQQEVRSFVENYAAAFQAHIMESHPDFLTVTLTEEMDKDIGNRPFYWSWVEKMNLPVQPLTLTFYFNKENMPNGMKTEHLHFGSARLQQIFLSARKHGRFVCLYEKKPTLSGLSPARRSTPLTPWLNLNVKVSFICDKRRDFLLHLGINLHRPMVVSDFYSFLCSLSLTPAIPDYFYTLERTVTVNDAVQLANQRVMTFIEVQDHTWADLARERLQEEVNILQAYYEQLSFEQKEEDEEAATDENATEESLDSQTNAATASAKVEESPIEHAAPVTDAPSPSTEVQEHLRNGGRLLDFLRMNGIQSTPKEQIQLGEWKKSTPQEEKKRRIDEMTWQYAPRIEISLVNGGIFYLHSVPPTHLTQPPP